MAIEYSCIDQPRPAYSLGLCCEDQVEEVGKVDKEESTNKVPLVPAHHDSPIKVEALSAFPYLIVSDNFAVCYGSKCGSALD